jgi:hypothetical protein
MWIRSPTWDGFWFLSGVPIGLALWAWSPPWSWSFYFLLLFRVGHLASPVALAWSREDFRQIMLRRKVRCIILPACVFLAAAVIGALSPSIAIDNDLDPGGRVRIGLHSITNPMAWLAVIYFVWNYWHFGMQNFGMLRLYAAKAKTTTPRGFDKTFCLLMITLWSVAILTRLSFVTPAGKHMFALACYGVAGAILAGMLIRERSWPRALLIFGILSPAVISFWSLWYAFAAIYLNHWLTAIGLSAHVDGVHHSRSPLIFALVIMGAGASVFLGRQHFSVILGASLGLSFVHFLYDRLLWKMGDPQVRATIGRDLSMAA